MQRSAEAPYVSLPEATRLADAREHAKMLVDMGAACRVRIVSVVHVPGVPLFAIIGHAISEGSVDVWKHYGALVDHIETIER